MGVQLGNRPKPSGDSAPTYDAGRGLDGPPLEIKREQPMLWVTALIFGLIATLAVAWGFRTYLMPANKVNVTLRITPPMDSQTALKLDGRLLSIEGVVLKDILLDKPHRLEIYQPHYIPGLIDFTVRFRNDEKYELEAKLTPLAKE